MCASRLLRKRERHLMHVLQAVRRAVVGCGRGLTTLPERRRRCVTCLHHNQRTSSCNCTTNSEDDGRL
jgi:hypothetical protein